MGRIKTIGLLCAALICLSAVSASGALAAKLGKVQTEAGGSPAGTTFTGTSGTSVLEQRAGAKVTCASATAEGTVESETAGKGKETFKSCEASTGGKCTLGATEG